MKPHKTRKTTMEKGKMSTRGRMLEKILDRFDLLCLNKKEETQYRAYNGFKSTIASEYKWSKE